MAAGPVTACPHLQYYVVIRSYNDKSWSISPSFFNRLLSSEESNLILNCGYSKFINIFILNRSVLISYKPIPSHSIVLMSLFR